MNGSAMITMATWQQVAIVILQWFSADKISQILLIYDSSLYFFTGQYFSNAFYVDIPDHNGKLKPSRAKLFIFTS